MDQACSKLLYTGMVKFEGTSQDGQKSEKLCRALPACKTCYFATAKTVAATVKTMACGCFQMLELNSCRESYWGD